jgi:rhamnogalacturonyl hydrolase YesR
MRAVRWGRAVRWYVREFGELLRMLHEEERPQSRCC